MVLFVDIPDEVVDSFECVQDFGYREFLVPADVLNRFSVGICRVCERCGSELGGERCWSCESHGDEL